jgi:hypothetical protein
MFLEIMEISVISFFGNLKIPQIRENKYVLFLQEIKHIINGNNNKEEKRSTTTEREKISNHD